MGDKFAVTPWLTLIGGVRQSHFASPNVSESPTSPRGGIAFRVPRLHVGVSWLLRPVLPGATPRHHLRAAIGHREYAGRRSEPTAIRTAPWGARYRILRSASPAPFKGWVVDADAFHTLSHNFLDHGNINYDSNGTVFPTNIFCR